MSGTLTETPFDLTEAIRNLVTEDDEPVDNILSEKQQRLLVDALYESWTPPPAEDAVESTPAQPRPFWAAANVGIFRSVHLQGIAPDVFISLDVTAPADLRTTEQLSYFMWEHGKPPEVVLEIVSNRKGKELESKRRDYAQMGVIYYVVFDPLRALQRELGDEVLRVYEIGFGKRYRRRNDYQLPEVGLSLTLWVGRFEDSDNQWLRWCDAQGNLLLTGHERAAQEAHRASRLAAKLRELGIDPEQV
jgi:Uma2 family endonuclease